MPQPPGPARPAAPEPRTHPAQLLQNLPRATRRRPGPRHLRAHGRRPCSRPAGQQQARLDRRGSGIANALAAGAHHCGPEGGARVAPPALVSPARRRRPLYCTSSAATSSLELKGPARRSPVFNLVARGTRAWGSSLPPRGLRCSPGVKKSSASLTLAPSLPTSPPLEPEPHTVVPLETPPSQRRRPPP